MKSATAGIGRLWVVAVAGLVATGCANAPATSDAETAGAANVALVQAATEAMWNQHDAAAATASHAPDFVSYTNGVRDSISGGEFLEATLQEWSDVSLTIDEIFPAGADRVVVRWTFHAVHKGTGQAVAVPGQSINEVRDGKVARSWDSYDVMPFALAAGATLTPPPGAQP